MELFTRFNEVGVTLLIATHDLELIERMPHRRFAPGRRPTAGDCAASAPSMEALKHYFGLHRDNCAGAIRRLAARPFASVLTILVIAHRTSAARGLARRRQQRRCGQRLWKSAADFTVYLKTNALRGSRAADGPTIEERADVAGVKVIDRDAALANSARSRASARR